MTACMNKISYKQNDVISIHNYRHQPTVYILPNKNTSQIHDGTYHMYDMSDYNSESDKGIVCDSSNQQCSVWHALNPNIYCQPYL